MALLPSNLSRVSVNLRTNLISSSLARGQSNLLKVQNELSTGKRLQAPSDSAGDSSIAIQLRKTLERNEAFLTNLRQAGSTLAEADSNLAQLTDLLRDAQTLASANVGSDVTADARKSAAVVAQSLFDQAMQLANRKFNGVYLFGGDRSTAAPFVEELGGVRFVGSGTVLLNEVDESAAVPFLVDGKELFGALSTRIEGTVDLSPTMTASTRLTDLRGALGLGIRLAPIVLSNGSETATVDLTRADTVGDVLNLINAAGVGSITASIAADGKSLQLTGGSGDNITVRELGGGSAAADLGILLPSGAGAGTPLNGADVDPILTVFTPLSALDDGAGIDLSSGIILGNGQASATISFSGLSTVGDLLNRVNGSGLALKMEINASGTGFNLFNATQGTRMTVAENGGTTASDLGLRSFGPDSPLAELNGGRGVRTATGADLRITDSMGVSFDVDLSGLNTIQDVVDAINTAAGLAGAGVTTLFTPNGNGIMISDAAGGSGTLTLVPLNFSPAAGDLGLTSPAVANVITGSDVNYVEAVGLFSHLGRLRDALLNNDQPGITQAAEGLAKDLERVTRIRGETGARVQEIESRQLRLEDQALASRALLSELEDTNYPDAVARFSSIQTVLQASMQTSGRLLNLSLLDFLG